MLIILRNILKKLIKTIDKLNKLIYKIFDGAEHNESSWAKQVEIPLLFFFGKNTTVE